MSENQIAVRPDYEKAALAAKDAFMSVAEDKTWKREIMFALQAIRNNNLLQKCDRDSIRNAVINLSLTGATLNPIVGQAYLVPRAGKCCLDFSYKGLAGIAMDSGSVKHLAPRLVYSFDEFSYEEINGEPLIKHKPSLDPPEEFSKGPEKFWDYIICGYVVATLHDGTKIITQPLPKWKLHKAMKTSKTTKEGTPWRTHPDEMSLKTLVKHCYKLLPQTDRMSQAVAVLNEHEGLEDKTQNAKTIMERFGHEAPKEIDIPPSAPEEPSECEFCKRADGTHEGACPMIEPPEGE